MATVPRAARRGGKVEPSPGSTTGATGGTVTPNLNSSTPPTVASPPADLKLPAATSPSPAQPADPDTPSFLTQGSLLQFNADTSSHVAMGVVRARGSSQAVAERPVIAQPEEVASKIVAALEAVSSASSTDLVLPALDVSTNDDIFLAAEWNLAEQMGALVKSNPEVKVLLVGPFAFSDLERIPDFPNEEIALWFGNHSTVTTTSRFIVTDVATAQLYLHTVHSLLPFTHVAFTKTTSNAIMFHGLWAELKNYATHTPAESRPKLIFGVYPGSESQSLLSQYFAPLRVHRADFVDAQHGVTKFNADEVAAITKLPAVVPATRQVDDRTGFTLPAPKVVDRAMLQAVALVKHLAEVATKPIRIAVFSADSNPIHEALSGYDKIVFGSMQANNSSEKSVVTVLNSVPLESGFIRLAPADVVIDVGTERVGCIVSKAEQTLPTRRVEWASIEECTRRSHIVGRRRPGLYFDLVVEEGIVRAAFATDNVATTAAESSLLQLARLGLDPLGVLSRACIKPSADATEAALIHLVEKGAIASSSNHGITFLGEFLARTSLPCDIGSFLLLGTTVGLQEIGAIIASLLLHPLRPAPPEGKKAEDWAAECSAALRQESVASSSDLLADVALYLRWLEEDKSDAVAKQRLVEPHRLRLISKSAELLLQRISDFIVPAASEPTPKELRHQLDRYSVAIQFLMAASMTRNAITVKTEAASGKPAAGSLVFVKTAKEVLPSSQAPTALVWKIGSIILPVALNNTANKFYASGGSLLAQTFFFSAVVALSPSLDYSKTLPHKGEDVVCFGTTVNKLPKRFYTDSLTAGRLMDFREKWRVLFGCLQVKRSLPPRSTRLQVLAAFQAKDRKFDIDVARQNILEDFTSLVESCEMKEYQSVFEVHNAHQLNPNPSAQIDVIAPATDVALCHQIFEAGASPSDKITSEGESPVSPIAPAAAPVVPPGLLGRGVYEEDDDDIEVEGQGFLAAGPIVEDD